MPCSRATSRSSQRNIVRGHDKVASAGLLRSSAGVRVGFSCLPGEIMSQLNHAYQGRQQPKLLDQVRYAIRVKHYSLRTEEA